MKEQLKKILLIFFLFYLGNISNSHADKVIQCFNGQHIFKIENKIAHWRTEIGWKKLKGKSKDGVWSFKSTSGTLVVVDFEYNRASVTSDGTTQRSNCYTLR